MDHDPKLYADDRAVMRDHYRLCPDCGQPSNVITGDCLCSVPDIEPPLFPPDCAGDDAGVGF
jgi:hypothetical protein